jgi:thioredoxin-related protein
MGLIKQKICFLGGLGFFFVFLLFIGGCAPPVTRILSTPADWLTDFEQARQSAREKNLPILAAFVGLDWCPWCQKLEEEVLSQQEFLTFAENHFVLFKADYPQNQEQPARIKEQNKALAKKYGIDSVPTVLILDGKGNPLAKTGYRHGGLEPYLNHLEEILNKTTSSNR